MRAQRGRSTQARWRPNWSAALVSALAALASQAAHGSDGSVTKAVLVVVAMDRRAERQAVELQASLAPVFAQDPRLQLVEPADIYSSGSIEQTAQQVASGRAALEGVRAAMENAEYQDAKEKAESALTALGSGDLRALRGIMLGLLLELAVIKQRLAVDGGGTAELTQALVLEPKLEVPRAWNTGEKTWFSQVRTAVSASIGRMVRFEREGEPGWVWVDGRRLGATPVLLGEVRPGRHFLTFEAPGTLPEHRSELLGSVDRITFSPTELPEGRRYRSLRAALASGFRQGNPGPAAAELAAWAKADEVLAVAVGDGAGARVYRLGAAGEVAMKAVSVAATPAVADALQRALDLKLAPPPGPEALERERDEDRQTQTPWVERSRAPGVVLLVLAAAAVATGTVLLIEGWNRGVKAKTIPQLEVDRYDAAINGANLMMEVGLGAYGGAVVCAGFGLFLVW